MYVITIASLYISIHPYIQSQDISITDIILPYIYNIYNIYSCQIIFMLFLFIEIVKK